MIVMNDNMKEILNEDSSILECYAASVGNIFISFVQLLLLAPMTLKMKAV
jgi:hypothetical protein